MTPSFRKCSMILSFELKAFGFFVYPQKAAYSILKKSRSLSLRVGKIKIRYLISVLIKLKIYILRTQIGQIKKSVFQLFIIIIKVRNPRKWKSILKSIRRFSKTKNSQQNICKSYLLKFKSFKFSINKKKHLHLIKCIKISIGCSELYATVDSTRYREGQITLNKKLQKFTKWRMKMCGISLAAQFGICQIDNKTKKIRKIYGLYAMGYAPAESVRTGYQFQNDTWIQLVYDPQEQSLLFFNEATKESLKIEIPEKKQCFEYYPYAFLYKATIYLNEEPDYTDPYQEEYYERMYEEHMKAVQLEELNTTGKKQESEQKLE